MKVMIKELTVKDLPAYFVSEGGFLPVTAEHLVRDLKEKIFAPVAYYLNLMTEIRALDLDKDIKVVIKEAGLVLPSEVLISRLKNILATYLKGIRNRIDTRATLAKDTKIGGLNLSPEEIDRVFKVCESHKFKNYDPNESPAQKAAAPVSRLDSIIKQTEKTMASSAAEYNLKNALKSGQAGLAVDKGAKPESQIKSESQIKLDTTHELEAPEKTLDLPEPEEELSLPRPAEGVDVSGVKPSVPGIKPSISSQTATPPVKPLASKLQPLRPKEDQMVKGEQKASVASAASLSTSSAAPVAPKTTPASRPAIQTIEKPPKRRGLFARLFGTKKKIEKKSGKPVSAPVSAQVPVSDMKPALGSSIKPNLAPSVKTALAPAKIPTPTPVATKIPASAPTLTSAPISTEAPIKTSAPAPNKSGVSSSISAKPEARFSPLKPEAKSSASPFPPRSTQSSSASSPVSAAPSLASRRPAPAPAVSRPQMHDIKPMPKALGPIEELQFLDLVNFRRLGKTPEEITEKILKKIKLLERDGYDKMVAGVRAWRQSPVNRAYLRLGQDAVSHGVSLKEAIFAAQAKDPTGLTLEEVEGVIALNGRLTF